MTDVGSSTAADKRLRIVLADDHAVMRQALRSILEHNIDVTVVGEATDGNEAVSMAVALMPDIMIVDVNMPRMDGIEATRQIKHKRPAITVIGLTVIDSTHVTDAMKAAGAEAVLLKDASEQLHETIKALVQRGMT